jgi:uncharacterized protein
MEEPLTFIKLAEKVLDETKRPLGYFEIWQEAQKTGLSKRVNTKGKTPWNSIGARIYVDVRDNPNSIFYQVSKHPIKFFLKKYSNTSEAVQEKPVEKKQKSTYSERDLHPLVTAFVYANQHFKARIKTVFHESSSTSKRGFNVWLHPDLVGVYLPFGDYDEVTLRLQKSLSISSVKIFSFELKKELTFSNLRQYYFQAVSNSSWAHEGYLVVGNLAEDSDLIDELRRLNNAFGIGLIKLNFESLDESEILFQSKVRQELDWDTVNRLIEENPHFERFMVDVEEDLQVRKIKGNYDKVLKEEELTNYMAEKKIGGWV